MFKGFIGVRSGMLHACSVDKWHLRGPKICAADCALQLEGHAAIKRETLHPKRLGFRVQGLGFR